MKLFFTLIITLCYSFATAQTARPKPKEIPAVKGHLLGAALNYTKFEGFKSYVPGLSVFYRKGIVPHLDFSIRSSVMATHYNKVVVSSLNHFIGELEAQGHVMLFRNGKLLNPYLTAGIGIGRYSKSIAPYAPLGVGLEMNINSNFYVFLQSNYRYSFNASRLDNSMVYSLGVAVNMQLLRKNKVVPPRVDSDGDGVADNKDECPGVAGLPRFKGCPDTDGDGIKDSKDQCPTVPGVARYKGCPVPDKDNDGVNDEEDKCPTVPGTAKYKGCPVPDTDGDGLDDEQDKCPHTKGPVSNQGCPEVKAEVKKKLEFAATAILFDAEKATIRKSSYDLLDEIVGILEDYKDHKLFLDGHTDNSGDPAKNMELSRQRAEAVKAYLVDKRIDAERVIVKWHGDTQPKVDNETAENRMQNRRVEMDLRTE